MNRTVPDYAMVIGMRAYSPETFEAEAQDLGISRRLNRIPKGMVLGASRVYCIYDAGRDSLPRKCQQCAELLEGIPPGPVPDTFDCAKCGHKHFKKKGEAGRIAAYFVPERLEVVLRVSDETARTATQMLHDLNLLDAKLEDSPNTLRVTCSIDASEGGAATRERLLGITKMLGVEADVDMLAAAIDANGARLALVAREPDRGCGRRFHGKLYAVAQTGNQSPLVRLDPPMVYSGQAFRGLKQLSEKEQDEAEMHVLGYCVANLKGELAALHVQSALFA